MLDCGASRVALGRFARTKSGGLRLETFACEPLGAADDANGWLHAMTGALSRLATRMRAPGPVTIVLPGHLVLAKSIRTPRLEAAKRDKIVRFEAQQNIPYTLADVVWGHAVTSESVDATDVVLCAAKLDAVDALCAAVEAAGFQPRAVLPGVLAWRATAHAQATAEPTLFVNLGARSATLVLLENDRAHARVLAFGAAVRTDSAHATVEARATRLAQEIVRTVAHFKRTDAVASPARIAVAGGAARVAGFVELLAARTGTPVLAFDPLAGLDLARQATEAGAANFGPQLADLVGAARVRLGANVPAVDLLPPRLRARERVRVRRLWFATAAVFAAAAFVPPLQFHREREMALGEKTAAIEAEIAPLRARESRNRANLEKLAALQREIAAVQGLAARRGSWTGLLADLQERCAKIEDVWLDRVQLASDSTAADAPLRLAVSGRMLDRVNPLATASPDASRRMAALLASVVDSPFVAAVEDERFDHRQPGLLGFEVVLVADPARPL